MDAEDISLSQESGSDDSSGEDSDSSEDGMQGMRSDLESQKQVSPSTFSKENEYLTSFMKPSVKPQLEERAQQSLDKESSSLTSPTKQAEDRALDAKQGQRAGDVTGHGGSMSAPHGSLPLIPQLAHKLQSCHQQLL